MLVQHRQTGGLRLIEQHAHALVCGDMALAWRGPGDADDRLSFETIVAIGLHDYPWSTDDRYALHDPQSGLPLDFLDYPTGRRLALYRDGLDELERLDRYAGLLVSRHYCAFKGLERQTVFQADERMRRERLREKLPPRLADPARQDRDLALLQLFDIISLYLCLAAPGADRGWLPTWLEPDAFARYPDGTPFAVSWRSEEAVSFAPSPWSHPFAITLPYRDLRQSRYASQTALDEAFETAEIGYWTVALS